jgi:hypothetical protein
MPTFVKAQAGMRHSVIYTEDTGKFFKYSGGSWSWRNHNPGNLRPGSVSRRNNQIGTAGKFAVFPDDETGRSALVDCLKNIHGEKSIDNLVESYVPPNENDTVRYRKFLHKNTGIEDNKKIKDFTDDEFSKLLNAIIKHEGYIIGTVNELHKVTKVIRDRGKISQLYVNDLGWKTTDECIPLAKSGALELVVCRSRSGNEYLRAQANDSFQIDLFDIITKEPYK